MRGKVKQSVLDIDTDRITPAYAGKSNGFQCVFDVFWDHPRLCGEKSYFRTIEPIPQGSPPPMRGKGRKLTKAEREKGITPTYAGKRRMRPITAKTRWDHPRLCGEKT